MLAVLKDARTFFFALERGDYNVYDNVRKQEFIEELQIVIDLADGLTGSPEVRAVGYKSANAGSSPALPVNFPIPPPLRCPLGGECFCGGVQCARSISSFPKPPGVK